MSRRNNPGQGQNHPCYDCGHTRNALRHAHREIADWHQWYETVRHILDGTRSERVSYNYKIHSSKVIESRLEARLMSQEREFTEELKKSRDIISERDSEISSLKQSLKVKTEEADNIKSSSNEENNSTAKWEAEKEKFLAAFEQKEQMLQVKLQIQDEDLEKVKQLDEQLKQRDADILALRKEKEDLSVRLMETANQLSSKQTELLQSEQTWQIKCDTLEENYTKELAEKQDSWEERVTKMEEKMVQLNGRSLKKNKNTETGQEEAGQTEVKKSNSMREKKDEEKNEKEKTENNQKEKQEKKKKGFWSWMYKMKKCDSDTKVEEAAGCSK